MLKKILCLDFDDVITQTGALVEQELRRINYKASNQYIKEIRESNLDEESKRMEEIDHQILLDEILEESVPEYVGVIKYEEIININNTFPNVISYINFLYESHRFSEICIVTHYNVDREKECKKVFIEKYLPKGIKYIPVKFHSDFCPKSIRRIRNIKPIAVGNEFGYLMISNCVLIDDTHRNIEEFEQYGGLGIWFTKNDNSLNSIGNLNPFNIMVLSELKKLPSGEKVKTLK